MLIFISHAYKDKREASAIKSRLAKLGLDVFVAHEDIDGGTEWITSLRSNIKKCDIFLVLFSKNYHEAQYTDQESGMAIGYDKTIIPIRIDDTEPYGFMATLQFATCSATFSDNEVSEILKLIALRTESKEKLVESLIRNLANASSFDNANGLVEKLVQYAPFTSKQVNSLAIAYINNYQVRGAWNAANRIKQIIKKNKTQLEPVVKQMLRGWSLPETSHIKDL